MTVDELANRLRVEAGDDHELVNSLYAGKLMEQFEIAKKLSELSYPNTSVSLKFYDRNAFIQLGRCDVNIKTREVTFVQTSIARTDGKNVAEVFEEMLNLYDQHNVTKKQVIDSIKGLVAEVTLRSSDINAAQSISAELKFSGILDFEHDDFVRMQRIAFGEGSSICDAS